MSRKDQIDELFRRELGDKGMAFAPEYWEQMEDLIAKRRRKLVKRGLWFSMGMILLISAISVLTQEYGEPLAGGEEHEAWGMEHGAQPSLLNEGAKETDNAAASADEGMVLDGVEGKGSTMDRREVPELSPTEVSAKSGQNPQVRHTERSRSTTDQPAPTKEVMVTGSEVRTFGQSEEREGKPILNSQQPIPNPQYLIPDLQPASLGSMLNLPLFPTTPFKIKEKTKNAKRLPAYTQWYLGSYFNYGSVKHRYDPAIRSWKSSNEKILPYSHYGVNARVSRRGASLIVGVGMRQWTERTNYTREVDHYTFDSTLKLVNRQFIQRPDGSYAALLRYEIDTTSHTTETETICKDCPVNFRYLTVPVAVHYEYGSGKWLAYTEAGMTFSFLSRGSGEYSVQWQNTPGKTPAMRTEVPNATYFSKAVVQAGLTLGLKYRIHPFVTVTSHVNYQRSLNSMMQLYRQESDFYGVGVGVEWKVF